MKKITFLFFVGTMLLIGCQNDGAKDATADSLTATKPSDTNVADTPPMDSASMMKAWEAYMTPGDEHSMLAKHNGTWTQEVTMWMDPSKPPTKNTAIAVNTMILGGRYQQSVSKGNFMGMPFEGISTTAYDNARKVFQTTWVDNMGTGIMNMEGTWDESSKSIEFKGKSTDPSTGKAMEVREIFKIVDDDTQTMEMFCMQGGKEMKTMEIKAVRKK